MKSRILAAAVVVCVLSVTGCSSVKLTAFTAVPQAPDRVSLKIEDRTQERMTADQRAVLNKIVRESLDDGGITVVAPGHAGAPALVGEITTYDPGNRLIRYCISFGAGKGHFASSWTLKDEAGTEVGNGVISGYIRAGFFGGSYKRVLKKAGAKLVQFLNGAEN